jgi:hypothetical protein
VASTTTKSRDCAEEEKEMEKESQEQGEEEEVIRVIDM